MTTTDERRILICYDGSDYARAAIDEAARLFPGASADVLTVYERSWPAIGPVPQMDGELEVAARDICDEGTRRARARGFTAKSLVIASDGTVWHSIVELADDHDHAAIVVGAQGRSALVTALLGGVSSGVAAHASCPVVVVRDPSQHDGVSASLDDESYAETPTMAGMQ